MPGPVRQIPRFAGDGVQRLRVCVEDRRHQQHVRRGYGDPDVDLLVQVKVAVDVRRVRARMAAQRQRGRLDHEVVQRRHRTRLAQVAQLPPESDRLFHGDLRLDRELGHGRRSLHALGDQPLGVRELVNLSGRRDVRRRCRAPRGRSSCGEPVVRGRALAT